ncbi:plasmid fertility inhibition factor family protein [Paraburkholderia adhaesiva]|uniref:plasmid fertility inhibition factor family protein n=1 Tax=Paraburkholderia adhaesiva TaxID=2883244 RepID=UPI0035715E33
MLTPDSSSSPFMPCGPFWIVQLPGHRAYDHVRLKRVFTTDGTRHEVVLVDLHRLLECADRDDTDYVLRPVDDWHAGKVRGIREFLDPENERVPQMPYVTISTRRAAGVAGWLGLAHVGVVAFRNGQHRARYLAWAGATVLPVEVHEREAPLLRELCGVGGVTESAAVPVVVGA